MVSFIKYFLAFLLTTVLCVAVFEKQSMASTAGAGNWRPVRLNGGQSMRETGSLDRGKIIEVLESRIRRSHLSEKAVQKLNAMNDEEIRLVASLCDRISRAGDTAGADVALLLVTALIVLS
jgi:hypothetical protein